MNSMMTQKKVENRYNLYALRENQYYLIGVFLSIIAIVIVFLGWRHQEKGIYEYFFLLPLFYGVLNILFIKVYKNITLCTAIVLILMFIRYTLTAFILLLDKYPQGVYFIQTSKEVSLSTAVIMIYEMLIIYCTLFFIIVPHRNTSTEIYISKVNTRYNFSKLNILVIGFIVFTILIHIVYPSLLTSYNFILNGELDSLAQNSEISQQNLPGGMRWIGFMCGTIARYVVLEWFILFCFKQYSQTQKTKYWFYSVGVITANMLVTNSMQLVGIIYSLVMFYQIYRLYPEKRKAMFRIFGVAGASFFIYFMFIYWANSLEYHSLSQMIQGYTNGFYNVYQSKFAYESLNQDFFEKVQMLIVGDSLGNINIVNRWIQAINSTQCYNNYIYGVNSAGGGAIVPLVAQMTYYFGKIVGPWTSFAFIFLMKKYEAKSYNAEGNILLNSFLSVLFAITPFVYNYSIVLHVLTVTVIPIWGIAWLNRFRIKK